MNPYALLIGVGIFAASVGGAYVQGRSDGRAHCEAASARDDRVAAIASEAAASAAAKAISLIEVTHTTVRQELEREIRTREVFRECRSGDDAVRLFNDSIPGAASAPSARHRVVPPKDTAR